MLIPGSGVCTEIAKAGDHACHPPSKGYLASKYEERAPVQLAVSAKCDHEKKRSRSKRAWRTGIQAISTSIFSPRFRRIKSIPLAVLRVRASPTRLAAATIALPALTEISYSVPHALPCSAQKAGT